MEGLQTALVPAASPAAEGHVEPAFFHLELLCTGIASLGVTKILAGDTSNTTFQEIVKRLGPHGCALVMMRAELDRALGGVWGGIAARCYKPNVEQAAKSMAATVDVGDEGTA